jgi:hypothetical protein
MWRYNEQYDRVDNHFYLMDNAMEFGITLKVFFCTMRQTYSRIAWATPCAWKARWFASPFRSKNLGKSIKPSSSLAFHFHLSTCNENMSVCDLAYCWWVSCMDASLGNNGREIRATCRSMITFTLIDRRLFATFLLISCGGRIALVGLPDSEIYLRTWIWCLSLLFLTWIDWDARWRRSRSLRSVPWRMGCGFSLAVNLSGRNHSTQIQVNSHTRPATTWKVLITIIKCLYADIRSNSTSRIGSVQQSRSHSNAEYLTCSMDSHVRK